VAAISGTLSGVGEVFWPTPAPTTVPRPELVAYRVQTPPVIDGDLGEWGEVGQLTFSAAAADYHWGKPLLAMDPRAVISARWDDRNLYLSFAVRDASIVTDSGTRHWQDDGIEVALDGAYDRTPGGPGDYLLTFRPDGAFTNMDQAAPAVVRAVGIGASGYNMELAIPLASLSSKTVAEGARMGITFGLRDDDDGGDVDGYIIWKGSDTLQGQAGFADLRFTAQVAPAAPAVAPERSAAEAEGSDVGSKALSGVVSLQQGINGYTGAQDTYLVASDCAEINLSGEGSLGLSDNPKRRVLLRYDLTTALPRNAVVTQAILSLRAYAGGWSRMDIDVYPLRRAWNAAEATWSQAAHGQPWRTAGAEAAEDRSFLVAATSAVNLLNVWYDMDVTNLVKGWAANPAANYGVIVIPRAGTVSSYDFYAGESPQLGWRPKLTVYYTVP